MVEPRGYGVRGHVDPDHGLVIGYEQNVAPILDHNHAWRTEMGRTEGPLGRKVASIPITVAYDWIARDGIEPQVWMRWNKKERRAYFARKVNDADHKFLRTVEGRI